MTETATNAARDELADPALTILAAVAHFGKGATCIAASLEAVEQALAGADGARAGARRTSMVAHIYQARLQRVLLE